MGQAKKGRTVTEMAKVANVRAQVAYVKGLLSGLGTDGDSREMRLITEMVKVLKDFAERLDELRVAQDDMEEYIRALDEDLYAVERLVFGAEDKAKEKEEEYSEQDESGGEPVVDWAEGAEGGLRAGPEMADQDTDAL